MSALQLAYERALQRSAAAAATLPAAASPARRQSTPRQRDKSGRSTALSKKPVTTRRTSGRKRARSPSPAAAAAAAAAAGAYPGPPLSAEEEEEGFTFESSYSGGNVAHEFADPNDDEGDEDPRVALPAAPTASASASRAKRRRKDAAAATSGYIKALATNAPTPKKFTKADASAAAAAAYDPASSPVYDTCSEVRRKIRAHLTKSGCTVAQFLRDCGGVSSSSYRQFMAMKTPLQGSGNCLYPAAYHFFERRRIAEGKPKGKLRLESESAFPLGHRLETTRTGYWCLGEQVPVMDRLGRVTMEPR